MHSTWPLLLVPLFTAQTSTAQGGATTKPLRYDAAVQAIMVPTDDAQYAEFNPAVHAPRVVIRNDGTDPLLGISIQYGTDGFLQRLYAWTGQLATGAIAEVTLPHLIDMKPGTNTFTVVLGHPNGRKDKNQANNTLSTTFTAAPVYDSPLTVRWRVPAGVGGSLRLENTRGPVPLERSWKAGPDTVYQELVELPIGSYFLQVVDSSRTAHATVRITNADGDLLSALRGKPKQGTVHQFRVEATAGPVQGPGSDAQFVALPERGWALVSLYTVEKGLLVVTDGNGQPVVEWHIPERTDTVQLIDLSAQPAGSYSIKLLEKGKETPVGSMDLFDAGPR